MTDQTGSDPHAGNGSGGSHLSGSTSMLQQLLDALGFPSDPDWIAEFVPGMFLEKGPTVSKTDAVHSFDIDLTACFGVLMNTQIQFVQRDYVLFLKRGSLHSPLTLPLGQGTAHVTITGDGIQTMHFDVSFDPNASPDVAIFVSLVKGHPPQQTGSAAPSAAT